MKSIEIKASTVDEAVKQAIKELDLSIEEVEIEVIEEPSKGFLGIIGGKLARIKATPKDDTITKARKYLENITEKMGIKANVISQESTEYIKMTISGESMGVIIGRRGETLDALQYLTNLVVNRKRQERRRIILDAEDYRERRADTLEKLARRLSEKVKRTGQRVFLEPMNPQERRIIHTALQNDIYVTTLSEGDEPYRKVVIMPRR
ncbi:MAG: protein jag [Firmicutes bacterium HGW-Firmicutes-12]|nr:MAG: protein jag [Firmicutes bacterium HGW-Firmicutes-12]